MKIGVGEQIGGLFHMSRGEPAQVNNVISEDVELWHKRLGHPSLHVLEFLQQLGNLNKSNRKLAEKPCDICQRAKQTRDNFPINGNKANTLFELIYCDIWGPYHENRACGSKYFLTIVDDYSRSVWVYLMKNKSDAPCLLL
ncbi:unnamed protein product, partial [Cuscuta europaea]